MPIDAETEQRLRELAEKAHEQTKGISPYSEVMPPQSWYRFRDATPPAAILSLLDTVAELRRDAERYRGLRDVIVEDNVECKHTGRSACEDVWCAMDLADADKFDAAIDRALTKQQDTAKTA